MYIKDLRLTKNVYFFEIAASQEVINKTKYRVFRLKMAIALEERCIFDPMLVKPKCV